jgi:hypothetical protein
LSGGNGSRTVSGRIFRKNAFQGLNARRQRVAIVMIVLLSNRVSAAVSSSDRSRIMTRRWDR